MIEIEWLDAPAVDASKVIGKVQQLQVTDFLADYTVKSLSLPRTELPKTVKM